MTEPSSRSQPGLNFEEVFRLQRERVAALAWQMTGSQALIDDVVQETFLLVHRHLPKFRGESEVSTWVYRIALRVAIRLRERERTRRQRAHAYQQAAVKPTNETTKDVETDEQRRRLAAALDMLSDQHRTVLTLMSLRDLTAKQIGEVLGIPEGTVWSRAAAARRRMRELMSTADVDHSSSSSTTHSSTTS